MKTIVAMTMNPAINKSSSVAHVLAERKLYCKPPRFEPGGGVNGPVSGSDAVLEKWVDNAPGAGGVSGSQMGGGKRGEEKAN